MDDQVGKTRRRGSDQPGTRSHTGRMDEQTRRLYALKAEVMQALGHPIRLAIIDCLSGGDHAVGDIAERVEAERSNVSRHLAVLLKAHIVENRKEGLHIVYRLKTPCVLGFSLCLTNVLRERAQSATALLESLEPDATGSLT